MFPHPRSSTRFHRALAAALLLSFVLATLGVKSNASDEPDPHSVEWVCKHAPERVRVLFDSLNLERRALDKVKLAVNAGDYPAACTALVAYYRNAPTAKWLRHKPVEDTGKSDPNIDPMLSSEFDFWGERARVPRSASGGLQWTYSGPKNDPEWGRSLNQQDYFNALMGAYLRTGRRAYVEKIDADVRDWILSNPHPGRLMKTGPWRGIEVTTRANTWVKVFYGLQAVDEFSPAARILILSSVVEHAQYLMLFHRRDADNWAIGEVAALGVVGCAWPEFRDAAGWRDCSLEEVGRQMGMTVYPDGAETELTAMYHRGVTETFDNYVQTYRQFGDPVPDSLEVVVKRMWTYLAYTLRPDGTSPQNNDSDRRDIRNKLIAAAQLHDRPDWTYIATNGKDGNKPRIGPSVTFPWAGHAIMRSGWDADAQWSFFDAGPSGTAHQHFDELHLSIDAFGRPLLVDAGRFNYLTSPYRDYFMSSAAHNVLLIDGAGQNKTPERAERPMPGGDYGSTNDFDYARGVFDAGYQGTKGRAIHTRTVVYVHDQFWIVADRIETDRARAVKALWHFAPDCSVTVDKNSVASHDAGKGNLRIVPVGGMMWKTKVIEGAENPIQGWYSGFYTEKEPNPTAVYIADIPGSTTFAWVLVPARGEVPPIVTTVLSSREDRIELRVQVGSEKAYVVVVPMNSWRPSVRREG